MSTAAPQDTAQLRDALAQMVHAATHHKADIRAALRDARAALNAPARQATAAQFLGLAPYPDRAPSAPAPGAWHLESLDRSPARLIDPAGDCAAMVYLTDKNRKRTPGSLDRAARIVAALNAANT